MAEQAVLNNLQGGPAALPGIIAKSIAEARGYIQAGGNDLDAVGTVPQQVIPHVIAIVRWRWLTSVSALQKLQTDARRDAYRDAMKALSAIGDGHPKVERPANPIATTGQIVNVPSVGERPHRFTHHSEDGI